MLANWHIKHRYGNLLSLSLDFFANSGIGSIDFTIETRQGYREGSYVLTKSRMKIIKQWIERGLLERKATYEGVTSYHVIYLKTDKQWEWQDIAHFRQLTNTYRYDDIVTDLDVFMQAYKGQW